MSRREWALLAAITLAGALIRFLTLGHQSYDHDEAITAARVLQPGLGATMHIVGHGERSPPLYYLVAWLWSKPFGTAEVGLRSLSALIGTLTIPIAWRAATELGSRRAGLIAAALVAANPYLIWYSQEARSYALLVLFGAAALVYFARSIRAPTTRSLSLWAIASALALLTHYFAAFLIAPQALWLLVAHRGLRPPLVAVGAVVIAGLALASYAAHQEGSSRRNGFTQTALSARAGETLLNFVASEEPAPFAGNLSVDTVQAGTAIGGGLLVAAAVAFIALGASGEDRLAAMAFGAVGVASIAVPLLLAVLGLDFINPRNLIGALVPLVLVAAIGFGAGPTGGFGLLAAAMGCLMFGGADAAVYASAQMERPDWRGAAEAIGPSSAPRILVVPHNGDDPLSYYLGAPTLERSNDPRHGVRQIALLSSGPATRDPGHGFKLVHEERLAPTFVLQDYRARHPVRLRRRELEHILGERSSMLVEHPCEVQGRVSSPRR